MIDGREPSGRAAKDGSSKGYNPDMTWVDSCAWTPVIRL